MSVCSVLGYSILHACTDPSWDWLELCNLQWEDVDDKGRIREARSYQVIKCMCY